MGKHEASGWTQETARAELAAKIGSGFGQTYSLARHRKPGDPTTGNLDDYDDERS